MEFPRLRGLEKVIIAMKGLPCTFKTEIASLIGKWATCRVFYIDDFLSALSLEKGYSPESMPSKEEEEEAEHLRRLSFESLYKSALRYLKCPEQCVVIKSRLGSTFELDCLLRLSASVHNLGQVTIIIIDCHAKNEHRLCTRLELEAADIPEHDKEWYKAWSRLDFEKARDDWLISKPDWDRHLSDYLINADERRRPRRVTRLVLDPADDLNFKHKQVDIHPHFKRAITSLLTMSGGAREEAGWIGEEIVRDRYEEVSYHKLRRYQQEMAFRRVASVSGQKKKKYLCATEFGYRCVFNTCTEGGGNDVDNCGVCDERVVSAGYTCLYCFLTLHKSCAELQGVNSIGFAHNNDFLLDEYPRYDGDQDHTPPPWKLYACKSCTEKGKVFSAKCNACVYQTHLKGGMFPTIINHDSHKEHPLFWGSTGRFTFTCKACGRSNSDRCSYTCVCCLFGYCMRCVSCHGKVEHKHGGHHHAMKLLYMRDEMVLKEDYWCGVCYEDMDPQHWFYSCLDCPSYEAHPRCIEPVRKSEETREQDHIN